MKTIKVSGELTIHLIDTTLFYSQDSSLWSRIHLPTNKRTIMFQEDHLLLLVLEGTHHK
jgi:hypothetical protein